MLYLDDRAAEVYADMHADLETRRVGQRVPVQRQVVSPMGTRFHRFKSATRRVAVSLRYRVMEWYARLARPQGECC